MTKKPVSRFDDPTKWRKLRRLKKIKKLWHRLKILQNENHNFDAKFFDAANIDHLNALDKRLNQNFFVGRAAQRIDEGTVDFLYGRSFTEGLIALVPRAIWPDKPVFAGSPKIVMDMTGFQVNESTSYGVGNVLEFYINFGVSSVVVGFLLLGMMFAWLDYSAASSLDARDMGQTLIYFMPAAAMIHPNGSFVEMTSGGAAALVASYGWRKLWNIWVSRGTSLDVNSKRASEYAS